MSDIFVVFFFFEKKKKNGILSLPDGCNDMRATFSAYSVENAKY